MLDALEALAEHRAAVVVIGAQAVYLRTGRAQVALAEATKDSDLAIDPRTLGEDPRVEAAMRAAGFVPDPRHGQPGAWVNVDGIPVDLMVPESFAGAGGPNARGARVPPHDRRAMRRARGLEATLVDSTVEKVNALDPADPRSFEARVAGPAALLVAKTYKIAERIDTPRRLVDKDAHDMYRILVALETEPLAESFRRLLADPISASTTAHALEEIAELAAPGPQALVPMMAGRAEEGIGDPVTVALSTSLLARDLLTALA
ncbi:hypothetical protein BJ973_006681 [Actinoplanes tereljensis]|nr:hypothetical protein [Actinoplanes tereljensis]